MEKPISWQTSVHEKDESPVAWKGVTFWLCVIKQNVSEIKSWSWVQFLFRIKSISSKAFENLFNSNVFGNQFKRFIERWSQSNVFRSNVLDYSSWKNEAVLMCQVIWVKACVGWSKRPFREVSLLQLLSISLVNTVKFHKLLVHEKMKPTEWSKQMSK